ncbi:MAG: hypothetical protein WCJ58_01290 [bacterium]
MKSFTNTIKDLREEQSSQADPRFQQALREKLVLKISEQQKPGKNYFTSIFPKMKKFSLAFAALVLVTLVVTIAIFKNPFSSKTLTVAEAVENIRHKYQDIEDINAILHTKTQMTLQYPVTDNTPAKVEAITYNYWGERKSGMYKNYVTTGNDYIYQVVDQDNISWDYNSKTNELRKTITINKLAVELPPVYQTIPSLNNVNDFLGQQDLKIAEQNDSQIVFEFTVYSKDTNVTWINKYYFNKDTYLLDKIDERNIANQAEYIITEYLIQETIPTTDENIKELFTFEMPDKPGMQIMVYQTDLKTLEYDKFLGTTIVPTVDAPTVSPTSIVSIIPTNSGAQYIENNKVKFILPADWNTDGVPLFQTAGIIEFNKDPYKLFLDTNLQITGGGFYGVLPEGICTDKSIVKETSKIDAKYSIENYYVDLAKLNLESADCQSVIRGSATNTTGLIWFGSFIKNNNDYPWIKIGNDPLKNGISFTFKYADYTGTGSDINYPTKGSPELNSRLMEFQNIFTNSLTIK